MEATKDEKIAVHGDSDTPPESSIERGQLINASGHVQEVNRNFSLLSLAGVGIVVGNVWPAIGYVSHVPLENMTPDMS
jgi:choline transport protein